MRPIRWWGRAWMSSSCPRREAFCWCCTVQEPGTKNLALNLKRVHKSQEKNNICSFKRLWGEGSRSLVFVVALRTCKHHKDRGLKKAHLIHNSAHHVLKALNTFVPVCNFSKLTGMRLRNIITFSLGSSHYWIPTAQVQEINVPSFRISSEGGAVDKGIGGPPIQSSMWRRRLTYRISLSTLIDIFPPTKKRLCW